jgi:hypothetical protein
MCPYNFECFGCIVRGATFCPFEEIEYVPDIEEYEDLRPDLKYD